MKTLVLSRPADMCRRARMRRSVPAGFEWSFFNATDGREPERIPARYAALVAPTFWSGPILKPGAIGCFLSHVRTWERCVAEDGPLLVLEDDVAFADDLGPPLGVIEASPFDVLFVNDLPAEWVALAAQSGAAPAGAVSLRETVATILAAGVVPRRSRSVGACGYVVRPAGARRLADLARRTGTVVGVDWFIFAAGVAGMDRADTWAKLGQAVRLLGDPPELAVGVAPAWLVREARDEVPQSTIRHSETMPVADYRARLTHVAADTSVGRGLAGEAWQR